MKSFYMELDAFDAETNKKIGVLTVSGKDTQPGQVVMTVPENNGFYVSSFGIIKLARLAEEALN